ncbi:MAG: hypothetical protein LAT78_13250 [Roseinatronobacter sp.]|jgi:lipopolysaccharide biosynthesis glycosyltransferase|nr:hypothetical protein [Roseinatronobacter sp.]
MIDLLESTRPAQHDRAIYFCTDQKFLPYTLFLADQIHQKCPQRDFDLVIVSASPLDDHPLFEKDGLRRIVLNLEAVKDSLFVDQRISLAAYLRIFVPRILQDEYRRMLYLDADMFYQRGDLSRLLDLDLQGKAIGAVRDLPAIRRPERINSDLKHVTQEHFKYFNSGMLLIDVPQYLQQEVDLKALEIARALGDKLLAHDQSALNLVLRGDWVELNPIWNFIYTHQTAYYSGFFDVCIFHFCGRRKPFKGTYGGFARRFTEPYRRFMQAHWPEALPAVQKGLQINEKAYLHYGVMLLHALNLKRYMKFEDGWLDDFDVR